MIKLNKELFIEKAKKIYGDKYDYSKVEYINSNTKVCIICPIHGEFWKTPTNHLIGKQECKHCKKEMSKIDFIKKAKEVHGDKYDYSKVDYVNNNTKVCIICPIHGEFFYEPKQHLISNGCPKCAKNKKLNTKDFIEKAKEVHGDKYDYSKVEYVNNNTKVCIICPIHGEFWQMPQNHINQKQGCSKCSHRSFKYTTKEIISKAKEVHGDKYDYSKVEYINSDTKVCIICPIHGEFWQKMSKHVNNKEGCPNCAKNKKLNTKDFIEKAKEVHGNKYDYSKVEYINTDTKVCIICKEHGEFWQTPHQHLNGSGCKNCAEIKNISETKLFNFLNENLDTEIIRNVHFNWLGKKHLDILIKDFNIAIEYQGIQHFKPNDFFGGIDEFNNTIKRDKEKYKLCKKNNIILLYFSYLNERELPKKYLDIIYNKEEDLLKEIKLLCK